MADTTTLVAQIRGIVGTIDERIRAFDQIAANLATLRLNGWDTAQKVKAGCWLGDGAGMHPAMFMNNHYVMEIDGKTLVEPKWEFIVGMLQSRIPGFKFEVLLETDDCAKVRMSDGNGNTHEVEYTVADAKRQGLIGRRNAWQGNTREMCFKQAVKRCGRRIGAAALMDLPVGLDGDTMMVEQAPEKESIAKAAARALEPSGAELVESGDKAVGGAGGAAPSPAPAAPDKPKGNPMVVLSARLVSIYGKQKRGVLLEKAALLYNEMVKAQTGSDPGRRFNVPQDIGPFEAEQIIEWIEKRPKGGGAGDRTAAAAGSVTPAAAGGTPITPPSMESGPPPVESPERDVNRTYDDFMVTAKRAAGLLKGRKFVVSPEGTGKLWFVDQPTLTQAGKTASVLLSDEGEVVVSEQDLVQLDRILSAECDKAERGRP